MECLPELVIRLGPEKDDAVIISLSKPQFQALAKVLGLTIDLEVNAYECYSDTALETLLKEVNTLHPHGPLWKKEVKRLNDGE